MKLMCPTQTGLDLTHDLTFHIIFCSLTSSVSGMRCPHSVGRQFTDSFYIASSFYDSFSTRRVTSTCGSVGTESFSVEWRSTNSSSVNTTTSTSSALVLFLTACSSVASPSRSRQLRFLQCMICNIIHKAFFQHWKISTVIQQRGVKITRNEGKK